MLKKVLSIMTLVTVMLSFTSCGNGISNNAYLDMINNKNTNKKVLLLAESQAPTYPTTKGDYAFAELVKERTNGKIEITVVPSSGLGPDSDLLAQAQMGTVDFVRISSSTVGKYSGLMNILSLPYLYRDNNHMWAVLNGPIGQSALSALSNAGLTGLTFYDSGARSFYNNKKEIKSIADLAGLRIRVQESDLMKTLVTSLGATPIAMDSSLTLQSLALGQVDGAENNTPTYVSSNQLNVAKYYTFDEHSRVPDLLVASSKIMQGLSKDEQDIIKKAALESQTTQKAEWKKSEEAMLSTMKAAGIKITNLDDASKAEFKKAVQPVYDKFGAQYKDVLEQIEATK